MATSQDNVVALTGTPQIDALTQGSAWTSGSGTTQLTYSLSINDNPDGGAWSTELADAARAALAAWSDVANIAFTEVDSGGVFSQSTADIALTLTGDQLQAFGVGLFPGPASADAQIGELGYTPDTYPNPEGDAFFDNYRGEYAEVGPGGKGFEFLLHEIGHTLGLKHSNERIGDHPSFIDAGLGSLDSVLYTVMSYNGTGTAWDEGNVATPMLFDIQAVQAIYGANMSYHAGDDTYVLAASGPTAVKAIWDAGGTDAIDGSLIATGATIDLHEGAFISHAGNTTAIAYGVVIENAIGGAGGDTIVGNSAPNNLEGGDSGDDLSGMVGWDSLAGDAGEDTLSGGNGFDLLSGGDDADALYGDNGDDTLYGDNGLDTLEGGNGFDWIEGGDGDDSIVGALNWDTMLGGNGDDTIAGGNGFDSLMGEAGDDRLDGVYGNDTIDGGAGNDWLEGFDGLDSIRGGADQDTIAGGNDADRLEGGDGEDSLIGQVGWDTILGGNGDDMIAGGNGFDSLLGDDGNDTINGVYGNDTIDGGAGDDVLLYTGVAPGDADLRAGSADYAANVEHMDISDPLAGLLFVGGAPLSDGQAIGDDPFVAGSTNIAFDGATHLLTIDVNGDGSYAGAEDFTLTLAGVTSVTYHAADSSFLLA